MTYPIEMPNTRQEGLTNFVKMAHNCIEEGDVENAKYMLIDLINDLESKSLPYEVIDNRSGNLPSSNYTTPPTRPPGLARRAGIAF